MSADNRKVTTDALETLGTIIGTAEARDAIHLAVEPVEAGESLRAGEHIFLRDGKAYGTTGAAGQNLLGIVDPFLTALVKKGQRFWLVVYPRQITSLRHVWAHPAFPDAEVAAPSKYSASEQWIRDFADRVSLHYDVLMNGAAEWVDSKGEDGKGWGEYLCFGGLLEGVSVPDEFWTHYDAVTGKTTPETHRGSFFTCSCGGAA